MTITIGSVASIATAMVMPAISRGGTILLGALREQRVDAHRLEPELEASLLASDRSRAGSRSSA